MVIFTRHLVALTICLTPAWSPAQTLTIPAQQVELPDHLHPIPQHGPSAADLQQPGELQKHIDKQRDAGRQRIEVPEGTYRTHLTLSRLNRCVLDWYGVTIIGTDPSKPTVRQAQTDRLTIRGLKVVTNGELAWSQEYWPGRGTLGTKWEGCEFRAGRYDGKRKATRHGLGVCFEVPRDQRQKDRNGKPRVDATCADAVFDFCDFEGFERGVETNGKQAVRIVVRGVTDFAHCNRPVWINSGGQVLIHEMTAFIGSECHVTLGPEATGSSVQPAVILKDSYTDDAGGISRVIDASRVTDPGQVRCVVEDFKANVPNGKGEGFNLFLLPKDRPDVQISVGRLYKTGKANVVPEVVP